MNNEKLSLQILKKLISNFDYSNKKYSETVDILWRKYINTNESNNNINGAVFEVIIGFVLTIARCMPFYMQAKVAYVPNVNYDFICYDKQNGPISLSAKTSLHERWKQADLGTVALKYIHRNARSYLVTLDSVAMKTRLDKIADCMGLSDFILANSPKFDELIEQLQGLNLSKAGTVEIIKSNMVIDTDNYRERYGS